MPAVRTYSKAPHFRPRASSLGSSPPSASFNPHFSVLKRQQVRCGNLSTVDHTSTPSHLSIFPYPVDSDGPPIAPKKLATYFKTHDIPQPVSSLKLSFTRVMALFITKNILITRGMGERPVQSYLIPFNALAKTVSPLSSPAKYSDSSSEFSWSPIRRLLQMRASPTPAHDNDPFTNTNTGIGGAEANTAHFDYLGAASSRVKQESPSAEDHIVAMRADYKGTDPCSTSPFVPGLGFDFSASSTGIGPFYGARYRLLPLPTIPLRGDHRLDLWNPPPAHELAAVLTAKTTTHLMSPEGSAVEDFWTAWEYCGGCKHVVSAARMAEHVCDLS
ncbi:hypothetical protein MVEN_00117200 [Mycena venus]|uniref:Uncharacterized protein n=1 Tax=Mycena venus TaxID=2733690 RepID=A0A8H6Z575_9AGAR|nr:hypothetical protein MVEN_00117200 [Mycena venus]